MQPRYVIRMTLFTAFLLVSLGLLFILLRSSPVAAQSCLVTPAPVAYWQLDETSNDSRPPYLDYFAANNATACPDDSCPMPANGTINGAQRFNGISTGITIDNPADDLFNWNANATFSIAFWMQGLNQPNGSTCSSKNEVMLGRDDPTSSNTRWWIGCRRDTGGAAYFQMRDGNSNGDAGDIRLGLQAGSTPVINDGAWHFITGVYDGSRVYLYVDGAATISQTASFDTNFSMDTPVSVGWLDLDTQFHYKGLLDEIALYNVALSADDIQRLYRSSRFADTNYCTTPPALDLGIDAASTRPDGQYLYAGENVTTTYIVQNISTAPLSNISVTNPICTTITPANISNLDPNAAQTVTCSFASGTTISNPPALVESVARAASGSIQSPEAINTFSIIQSGIALTRTASSAVVAVGDVVTYTYTVANIGNIWLDNLVVQDECTTSRLGMPLAAEATWEFSCHTTLTTDTEGVSTVTGTDPRGTTRTDTASAPVDVVANPAIAITRTSNPDQPVVGETVTFTYTVRNTGADLLTNVIVTDPQCPAGVAGPNEGNGNGDAVFDPGETWSYSCTASYSDTETGPAQVTAQDALGRSVSATTDAQSGSLIYLPLIRR